jgi:hypothetical protein
MLSDTKVAQILETEISSALGSTESSELQIERGAALDFYNGRPVGDLSPPDIPGRSEVVSTDVEEVVEWILPSLLKTFTQTDEAVRFDAATAEDEEQAQQETDYCNYVFYKDNGGFLTLYSWFKDALLLKNGYVKTYYDESIDVTYETYSCLSEYEMAEIVNDDDVEVQQATPKTKPVETEMGVVDMPVYDLFVKRTAKRKRVVQIPCPPENTIVNADHQSISLKDARFVAHEEVVTASDLRSMGVSQSLIERLPKYGQEMDEVGRNTLSEEEKFDYSDDKSQDKYRLYDCYVLMDYDEDGIAERRRILFVRGNVHDGKQKLGNIIDNEPFDCVQLSALAPYINPHRHIGRSIYDRIKEIQKQKTYVWRSLMDNLYFQTNSRTAINENKVNVSDMLLNGPGNLVRVDGEPGAHIMPIVTPAATSSSYKMIEFIDNLRNGRTGIGPDAMGQNFDISNDTAHGIERIMSAKEELVGLIARIFAETGVKDMFLQLHSLLIKHPDKERVVKLRGSYIQVDPSEWRERTSMTVKVGLGTGDQLKKQMAMEKLTQDQKALAQMGGKMVNEQVVYKALLDKYKLAGVDARQYFTDPNTVPDKPKQPDPQMMLLQLQAKIEQDKTAVRMEELKVEKAKMLMAAHADQNKTMTTEQKNANDQRLKEMKMLFDMEIQKEKIDQEEERIAIDAYEAGMKNYTP